MKRITKKPRGAAQERVRIPLEFAQFMRSIFGRRYHQFENRDQVSEWRRALLRLTSAVAVACNENIASCDRNQRDELKRWTDNAIRSIGEAKRKDEISASAIEGLARLCFQLLGGQPLNYDCASVNKPAQLRVDDVRSVHYSQSESQKSSLIRQSTDRNANAVPSTISAMVHRVRNSELVERVRADFPEYYVTLF